ncbi:T9SS type A sorting domain-containing protein [Candidatus Kapabacteria bacterium]|nr:T9SS type A sorting domain-containing protein [Candidatus Kapabacteria bacterium]
MKAIYILLFISSVLYSQKSNTVSIWGETDTGIISTPVVLGLNSEATTGLDKGLEVEIFPAKPPGDYGVLCWLNYFDETQNAQVWSYTDLIPYIDTKFYYEHKLDVNLDYGRPYTLKWDNMKDLADSAYLSLGGDFIKIDMLENQSYYSSNENVSTWNFVVKIWYNTELINQINISEQNGNILYPTLAKDVININNYNQFKRIDLISIDGKTVISTKPIQTISIANLKSGIYFVNLFKEDGNVIAEQILVIK